MIRKSTKWLWSSGRLLSSEKVGVSVAKGSKQTDKCRSVVDYTVARDGLRPKKNCNCETGIPHAWHLTSKWILTWFYLSIIFPPISAWLNLIETPWLPHCYRFIFLSGPHRKKQQVPSHASPCGCTHSSSRVHLIPDVLRQDTDALCMACTFEGGEKERLL